MEERIGPYVVDGRIGMGGMGVVYVAHDEALHRRVALKVISPQLADDAGFRARFVREARALASLDSPHVVSVYAHGETDGRLWMATQYFPDGDLGTLLRRNGPPAPADGLELMAQVADGLAAAHAVGLVHRDIKPANVLLRRDGMRWRAALADFGIARTGSDQTGLTQGGMVGTPSFMAPELHRGAEATAASDLYSMGCLVWTVLTGTTPFTGTTDYEVVTAHIEEPAPRVEAGTPQGDAINRVLQRALAKDPAQRHGSAAELSQDLRVAARAATGQGPAVVRRAGSGVPTPMQAPPTPTPTPTPVPVAAARSSRIGLWAAGAVALVLVGTTLSFALVPRGDDAPDPDPTASSPTTGAVEDPTSGTPSPTAPTPSSPTLTAPSPPEPAGTDESTGFGNPYDQAVLKIATESFAAALEKDPTIGSEHAVCIAKEALSGTGLEKMTDAGFFTSAWTYVDQDLEAHPDIQLMLATATFGCVVP